MKEVKIFQGTPYSNANGRGIIDGAVLTVKNGITLLMKDIHLITFPPGSREPTENHYHPEDSGIYQYFVILGKLSKKKEGNPPEAVTFRFKKAGRLKFEELTLRVGDSCFVPAGFGHAFRPEEDRLCIACISNKPFSQAEEKAVTDRLF